MADGTSLVTEMQVGQVVEGGSLMQDINDAMQEFREINLRREVWSRIRSWLLLFLVILGGLVGAAFVTLGTNALSKTCVQSPGASMLAANEGISFSLNGVFGALGVVGDDMSGGDFMVCLDVEDTSCAAWRGMSVCCDGCVPENSCDGCVNSQLHLTMCGLSDVRVPGLNTLGACFQNCSDTGGDVFACEACGNLSETSGDLPCSTQMVACLGDLVNSPVEMVMEGFEVIGGLITSLPGELQDFIIQIGPAIVSALADIISTLIPDEVLKIIEEALAAVWGLLMAAAEVVAEFISGPLWDTITSIPLVGGLISDLGGVLSDAWDAVHGFFSSPAPAPQPCLSNRALTYPEYVSCAQINNQTPLIDFNLFRRLWWTFRFDSAMNSGSAVLQADFINKFDEVQYNPTWDPFEDEIPRQQLENALNAYQAANVLTPAARDFFIDTYIPLLEASALPNLPAVVDEFVFFNTTSGTAVPPTQQAPEITNMQVHAMSGGSINTDYNQSHIVTLEVSNAANPALPNYYEKSVLLYFIDGVADIEIILDGTGAGASELPLTAATGTVQYFLNVQDPVLSNANLVDLVSTPADAFSIAPHPILADEFKFIHTSTNTTVIPPQQGPTLTDIEVRGFLAGGIATDFEGPYEVQLSLYDTQATPLLYWEETVTLDFTAGTASFTAKLDGVFDGLVGPAPVTAAPGALSYQIIPTSILSTVFSSFGILYSDTFTIAPETEVAPVTGFEFFNSVSGSPTPPAQQSPHLVGMQVRALSAPGVVQTGYSAVRSTVIGIQGSFSGLWYYYEPKDLVFLNGVADFDVELVGEGDGLQPVEPAYVAVVTPCEFVSDLPMLTPSGIFSIPAGPSFSTSPAPPNVATFRFFNTVSGARVPPTQQSPILTGMQIRAYYPSYPTVSTSFNETYSQRIVIKGYLAANNSNANPVYVFDETVTLTFVNGIASFVPVLSGTGNGFPHPDLNHTGQGAGTYTGPAPVDSQIVYYFEVPEDVNVVTGGIPVEYFEYIKNPWITSASPPVQLASGYAYGVVWYDTNLDQQWVNGGSQVFAAWLLIPVVDEAKSVDPGPSDNGISGFPVGTTWANYTTSRIFTSVYDGMPAEWEDTTLTMPSDTFLILP